MKVRVKRENRLSLAMRVLNELVIGGRRHFNLARMDRIEARSSKARGCAARQSLIEQQLHALFGSSSTLSSIAVAA